MTYFKNKKIIFGAPINFGFSDIIKKQLEHLGFEVYDFSTYAHQRFKYRSIWQRLYNTYRKVLLNDFTYKDKLRAESRKETLSSHLEKVPDVDYTLFIRPDFFPLEFVKAANSKAKISTGYQWDGFDRFPNIQKYINLFDRFFAFDLGDVKGNILPITNFYFSDGVITPPENKESNNSAYFVGTYDAPRFAQLTRLSMQLQKHDYTPNFVFFVTKRRYKSIVDQAGFDSREEYLSYEENLKLVQSSGIIVDIHDPIHKGLSFRLFEALKYDKKIITTNDSVRFYDFYQPENIYILNKENHYSFSEFLRVPKVEVSPEIKMKYGFENWIKYVFDVNSHQAIQIFNS